MRVKKQKRHRRVVRFYSSCFGFREPFNVLCDGTFIHHLIAHRLLPADDALAKLLGARATLFSSRCITAELKSLGDSHSDSLEASQQLKIARCDHEKRVSAGTCIQSIIGQGNTNHYFIATQDTELRRKLREKPGVPIVFGLKNSLFLEQPSMEQRDFVKSSEEERLHISETEIQMLWKKELKNSFPEGKMIDSAGAHDAFEKKQPMKLHTAQRRLYLVEKSKFKRNKAKGPNPLSCKKKKVKESSLLTDNQDGGARESTKRKRNRKRKRSHSGAKVGQEGS